MPIVPIELPEEALPLRLGEIPDPPKRLWYAGKLPSPETTLLTVVGARKHSSYGKDACATLIGGLRGYDIGIVSGLALGIDAIAHRAALSSGLYTLAVPGSGLDERVLYPRTNLSLAREIVDSGGGLISEFPSDTPAATWTFPQRNRIMAGIAQATLVIEAEKRSGTLITSRLATDYNRDVFAVPGEIFSPLAEGPNMLIALGATPIHSSDDILRALGFAPKEGESIIDLSDLSDDERRVMEALTETLYRETLIERLGLSPSEGNILLMRMEIAGLVIETPTGIRRA